MKVVLIQLAKEEMGTQRDMKARTKKFVIKRKKHAYLKDHKLNRKINSNGVCKDEISLQKHGKNSITLRGIPELASYQP